MIHLFRVPIAGKNIVTIKAIVGKTSFFVVGVSRGVELVEVATYAVISDAVETQCRLGGMAVVAGQRRVDPREREAILLV